MKSILQEFKQTLTEQLTNVTVLFPGGFKPITGAHLGLANRYAENPNVRQVIMLIGPKDRDGFTREQTMQSFELLNSNPKIRIEATEFNSPIMAAYEYLFALPEDAEGQYAMAASAKGDDYARTTTFVPNVEKYKLVGDKKGRKIPQGVRAVELTANTDPLKYPDGTPISATSTRSAIANGDFNLFKQSYPGITDDILKNVWEILTGKIVEATLSKNWWISQLEEDIQQTIEGYTTLKNSKRHDKKVKKLRTHLNKNIGKEFVYDFDEFDKTVVGVPLSENYITRSELSQIEAAADRFFKEYGIDVDMQGRFTHFFERLNDPRNEGTIDVNELEDLFRELADEYGEDIATQLQRRKDSAVVSDLATDVPIHMPFMLRYSKHDDEIKLIPRTIKKQRRPWQSNNPNDVKYTIESVLTEGGAAGHMAHPYDDHGLTFREMKELISRALQGHLDIEEAVTEKTDGQNLQVTWKNGAVGFARNKGTIINPMSVNDLINKFAEYQGPVADAFREAANDLYAAFSKVNPEQLRRIFKDGNVFANMEIIYPATKNIIAYDKSHIQFHNLVEYSIEGTKVEKVQTDLTGGALIQRVIQDANAATQNTFSFIPPQKIKLGRIEDFEDQQAALFNELDQLRNQYKLSDSDLLSDYHRAWWTSIVNKAAEKLNIQISDDLAETLVDRWAFGDKSTSLTALKKQIESPELLNWVLQIDKTDLKQYQKRNMEPFESIFLRLGALVLSNVSDFLAANPSQAVQTIKSEIAQLIKQVKQSNDPKTLEKVETQLRRLQKLGGFDKIVPIEGIVFTFKGNTYKLTGAFAPVNQLIGILKYGR